MMTDEEHIESDEDLLEQLRHYSGWYYWHPDLDGLGIRALKAGCLRTTVETAHYKWSVGRSSSSNSSQTVVAIGPSGWTEDNEAFLGILRVELRAELGEGASGSSLPVQH